MIKIDNVEVVGLKHAIRGMRNPMNSWAKSDSEFSSNNNAPWIIGENDLDLMKRLRQAGTDHRKYMRMITVYLDVTAPLYWWKEFDTYKVGTVANSCSTMHKIHDKEFVLDDFSHEHLTDISTNVLNIIIQNLNYNRNEYNKTKDKLYFNQMIQLLPTSYYQKRTIMLNYEVLANMYKSRKNHKLDEWREICRWIETLPLNELIRG